MTMRSTMPLRSCLLLMVMVSASMLLVQMHILEHHVTMENLLPETPTTLSLLKDHPPESDDECDTIVDQDDHSDSDLKPILKILCRSGYDISSTSLDRSVLPKWSTIVNFYGPPRLLGLETCSIYRNHTLAQNRHVAPAGLFNTGTNLLDYLIYDNCDFGKLSFDRYKASYQVPWGKHVPVSYRYNHSAGKPNHKHFWNKMNRSDTLPVLAVRDPYTWMQSMCRMPYAAKFEHQPDSCPNIVPYEIDQQNDPTLRTKQHVPVSVKYADDIKIEYQSLAHYWNEWNSEYIQIERQQETTTSTTKVTMKSPTDFPFLVVRLEDLIFHAQTLLPKICECGGGSLRGARVNQTSIMANGENFDDAHQNSGLLRSIVKYGNIAKRREDYPKVQLRAAKESLDPSLMDLLGYPYEEYE